MVRPVTNEENLRNLEYLKKVSRKSSSEKDGARDFSYEFHDQVNEKSHHDHQESQNQQDSFQPSEDLDTNPKTSDKDQKNTSTTPENGHEGLLDITV